MAVILQLILVKFPFKYIECFASLALGGFLLAAAQVENLKIKLCKFNQMANDKRSREHMYKKLSEFIRQHSIDKQLSEFGRFVN